MKRTPGLKKQVSDELLLINAPVLKVTTPIRVFSWLTQIYLKVFSLKRDKPLKIGIEKDIAKNAKI